MCGISAIFSPEKPIEVEVAFDMIRAVRHRGPDDGAVAFFGSSCENNPLFIRDKIGTEKLKNLDGIDNWSNTFRVAIGHRRLSILDLTDGGLQPISSADGRYWLSYNGELYNHSELRKELEHQGARFTSNSDTEVLLNAYIAWGEECLNRFNGMFAFIIFDLKTKTIFAARDRFGVKPLYYRLGLDRSLYVASEIKQFSYTREWSPRLNEQRAYDFLAWGITDHTRETNFKGVYQLSPGHKITLSFHDIKGLKPDQSLENVETPWYQLHATKFTGDYHSSVKKFRDLLNDSIARRLIADVAVGANLSGGIDSSSIVCIMNEINKQKHNPSLFHTLTATSKYKLFDESAFANLVAKAASSNQLIVETNFDTLENEIDNLVWHQDEPFASTSIFAEWCIYQRAAAADLKVLLGGQGADEQLAGYPEHVGHFYRNWLKTGSVVSMLSDFYAGVTRGGQSARTIGTRLIDSFSPQSVRQSLRRYAGSVNIAPPWLDLDVLGASPYDPIESLGYRRASVREASKIQLTTTNLPMQLRWEDRDSMAHSIESRAPYLDYELVEFLFSIPDNHRYSKGVTKRILRDACKDVVPSGVINRMDKIGFATPEAIWVRQEGAHFFRKKISDAVQRSNGVIKPSSLQYFDQILNGKRKFSHELWRTVSFGMWLDRFSVKI